MKYLLFATLLGIPAQDDSFVMSATEHEAVIQLLQKQADEVYRANKEVERLMKKTNCA